MFGLKFFVLIIATDSSLRNLLTLIVVNAGEPKPQFYSLTCYLYLTTFFITLFPMLDVIPYMRVHFYPTSVF
jgi:hypothetical protein